MSHDEHTRDHHDLFPRHRLVGFDYSDRDHAYFVTICAQAGTRPFTGERLARDVVTSLHSLRDRRRWLLYAYCLMPDHLHLLLRLGEAGGTLGATVGAFKTFTTRKSWQLGSRGQLWQDRFYDHIVRRSEDGERIAVYILDNPVRKGLVGVAEDYLWSGRPDPL